MLITVPRFLCSLLLLRVGTAVRHMEHEDLGYRERTVSVNGHDVFIREMNREKGKQQVLLLHGAAFSSETWLKVSTPANHSVLER